jgi:hypothetical protein
VKLRAQDAEGLVAQCLHSNGRFVSYQRSPKHGEEDKAGIDFSVMFMHSGIHFKLQVKTSDNGETLGLWVPLPNHLPVQLRTRISPQMLASAQRHTHKYPSIRALLFVALPSRERSPELIVGNIWHEIWILYQFSRAATERHMVQRQREQERVAIAV